eukprot:TRINITY_DN25277_c0_g1_i2.p1 TRINITY_DN25277_c0_g1~~TRINITY_DN25277_c0_g1_i2.p1  ORF type:complete len:778 (-),score=246.19 TRINITY_DN25277_c0_g1_i2:371-2584(-)
MRLELAALLQEVRQLQAESHVASPDSAQASGEMRLELAALLQEVRQLQAESHVASPGSAQASGEMRLELAALLQEVRQLQAESHVEQEAPNLQWQEEASKRQRALEESLRKTQEELAAQTAAKAETALDAEKELARAASKEVAQQLESHVVSSDERLARSLQTSEEVASRQTELELESARFASAISTLHSELLQSHAVLAQELERLQRLVVDKMAGDVAAPAVAEKTVAAKARRSSGPVVREVLLLAFEGKAWPLPPNFGRDWLQSLREQLGVAKLSELALDFRGEGGSIIGEVQGPRDTLMELQALPLESVTVLGMSWKTLPNQCPDGDEEDDEQSFAFDDVDDDDGPAQGELTSHAELGSLQQEVFQARGFAASSAEDCRKLAEEVSTQKAASAQAEMELRKWQSEMQTTVEALRQEQRQASKEESGQERPPEPTPSETPQTVAVAKPRSVRTEVVDTNLQEWRSSLTELRGALCRTWAAEPPAAVSDAAAVAAAAIISEEQRQMVAMTSARAAADAVWSDFAGNFEAKVESTMAAACSAQVALAEDVVRLRSEVAAELRSTAGHTTSEAASSDLHKFVEAEVHRAEASVDARVSDCEEAVSNGLQTVRSQLAEALGDVVQLRRQVLSLCDSSGLTISSADAVAEAQAVADLTSRCSELAVALRTVQEDVLRLSQEVSATEQNTLRGIALMQNAVETVRADHLHWQSRLASSAAQALQPLPVASSTIAALAPAPT